MVQMHRNREAARMDDSEEVPYAEESRGASDDADIDLAPAVTPQQLAAVRAGLSTPPSTQPQAAGALVRRLEEGASGAQAADALSPSGLRSRARGDRRPPVPLAKPVKDGPRPVSLAGRVAADLDLPPTVARYVSSHGAGRISAIPPGTRPTRGVFESFGSTTRAGTGSV
jgi:hypothetical protein